MLRIWTCGRNSRKVLVAVGAGHDDFFSSQLLQFPGHIADNAKHDVFFAHEIAGRAAAVEHDPRIRQFLAQVGVGLFHYLSGAPRQGAAREKDPGRLAGGRVGTAQGKGGRCPPLDVILDALMGGQRPLTPGHQGFPGCQAGLSGVEVLGADRLAEAAVMTGIGE